MTKPMSRRNFLVAAVAVPVAAGVTAATAAPALAVDQHDQFTAAATKYGVPAAVLAAISYGQTRWEDHAGAPSTSLGYGPMHLVDGTAAQAQRDAAAGKGTSTAGVIDTLGRAAKLSGLSEDILRTDPAANITGAAAVLANAQRTLGHAVGTHTDPATWYEAIAASSGFTTAASQRGFADDVIADLRSGVAKKASGVRLELKAGKVGSVTSQRAVLTRRVETAAKTAKPAPYPIDAPKGLPVDWVPAPYEQLSEDPTDYGNHDLARRPVSPALNTIVIHDMEGYYAGSLKLVQDPTYLAWNYSVRSSDGLIAQHLEAADVGWHAGNWYVNSHSIGVEHEGFAVSGPTWFSEPMYRKSARLIRYLAQEYKIPLDRAHIIGHDQVPATTTAGIKSMHWDPGPFWDWEHYFELLKAPLTRGTGIKRKLDVGDVIRILPGFDGNEQIITGCDTNNPPICVVDGPQAATNFVALHLQPDEGAPLVNDIGMKPDGSPATTKPDDVGARANTGTDFVVAGVYGDWTAIWYLGQKAWFQNPAAAPTARLLKKGVKAVPKDGRDIQVYGRAYPEASAYSNPDDVQAISPFSYTWAAGQEYVIADQDVPTDYYKAKTYDVTTAGDHIDIVGTTKYYLVYFGHRVMYVMADDVELS
ncbi:amidase [Flexivirga endophytica]|uniref:N-acetylmuramoyl-L-alanine amidase n=1 Tax=Flexivirga endophytica TaxID=1849103 RepID=A0A916SVD0_9MICO|nr:N-acetylmuramoyl-L-alanine amidase [Flexivirga endophytica]GGB15288.1 amidase [Flexivirga endophytica]GHB40279.1 amidase [Flexivirga endophytica]